MLIEYGNLLVIVGVAYLNLTKFGVGWFKRVLEIECCEMEEMRWSMIYNSLKLTHAKVIFRKLGWEWAKTKGRKVIFKPFVS